MIATRPAALALALLAAVGCAPNARHEGDGTLRVALQHDVTTLNPLLGSSTVDGFVQRFLFEPLISLDERGATVPILARAVPSTANGGISRDGRTITYRLRPGLRWSDGAPLTSEDVRFSWSAIMNPRNNAVSRHGYDVIARIDAPDPATVVVHLTRPFAPFVETFFAESDQPYAIVPAHVLRAYASINRLPFNEHPSATDGPFRLVRWSHGNELVFERNERFFLRRPKLARLVVKIVPDENTSAVLLRTHSVDMVYEPSVATYPSLRAIPGVRIEWVDVNGYTGLNVNTARPPLDDPAVRRALAAAIDKNALVRTLTFGQERAATADLPDWLWAANRALRVPAPNPALARRVAAPRLARGAPLVLVTDVANVTHKRAALQVQAMLHGAGIETTVKYYPADLLYAPKGAGGILNSGRYDLAITPWFAGSDPDNSSQFACASRPPNGWNVQFYCTAEMDSLQRDALSTYDRGRRRAAYARIEALVVRDAPIVTFWWQRKQQALDERIGGFAPNAVTESWNAWRWSILRACDRYAASAAKAARTKRRGTTWTPGNSR